MKRVLVVLAVVLFALPASVYASRPVASLLPKGAHILAQAHLSGYRHAVAIAFDSGGPRVAVALTGTRHDRLVWSQKLSVMPAKVLSPGPNGAFLVVSAPVKGQALLSAFRLHAGHVTWAFSSTNERPITVSSLTTAGARLTATTPDASHQGSVPYEFRSVYRWSGSAYVAGSVTHRPALAPSAYPVPNGLVHLVSGDIVLMKLETAWTPAEQEMGLMYRTSLDPDSGMVFIWPDLVDESFWMENTFIPLTVAFLGPDGTILDMQDMAPRTTDGHAPDVSHCASQTPGRCYQFAIEMNKDFFTANGIKVGDKVTLALPCSSFQGFQSAYVKCYS